MTFSNAVIIVWYNLCKDMPFVQGLFGMDAHLAGMEVSPSILNFASNHVHESP